MGVCAAVEALLLLMFGAGCPKEKERAVFGFMTGENRALAGFSFAPEGGGGLACIPSVSDSFAVLSGTTAAGVGDGTAPNLKRGAFEVTDEPEAVSEASVVPVGAEGVLVVFPKEKVGLAVLVVLVSTPEVVEGDGVAAGNAAKGFEGFVTSITGIDGGELESTGLPNAKLGGFSSGY